MKIAHKPSNSSDRKFELVNRKTMTTQKNYKKTILLTNLIKSKQSSCVNNKKEVIQPI